MQPRTSGHRTHPSTVCLVMAAFALISCGPNVAPVRVGTPTAAMAPASLPAPPIPPNAPGVSLLTVAAPPISPPSLPTPRPPAAITLTADIAAGAAPLAVTFTIAIPAGVGTGCEADVYRYGDGSDVEAYLPCALVITPAPPGKTPTSFIMPTWPPRSRADTFAYIHTYRQPGVYAVQFALREKPSDRIVAVSNTVAITVT